MGLDGAVKTSGAKGVHVFVPDRRRARRWPTRPRRPGPWPFGSRRSTPTVATTEFVKDERGGKVFVDSTRVGGATVVAAYSPRVRPGTPVSFPVAWDDLDDVRPADFTVHTALGLLGDRDPVGRGDAVAAGVAGRPGRARATTSPSPACRRCTRASAAPEIAEPAATDRPGSR